MREKGVGNPYELLIAIIAVVIIATFYAKDAQEIMPMLFILVGAVLISAGAVNKESNLMTGGILFLGLALLYSEIVL